VKVTELRGAYLDYWVARAEGYTNINGPYETDWVFCLREPDGSDGDALPEYSTDWSAGGPIIEREEISIRHIQLMPGYWVIAASLEVRAAEAGRDTLNGKPLIGAGWYIGDTPLQAAMRAFVASKFGKEVPDEEPA